MAVTERFGKVTDWYVIISRRRALKYYQFECRSFINVDRFQIFFFKDLKIKTSVCNVTLSVYLTNY